MRILISIFISLFLLTACSHSEDNNSVDLKQTIHNPTAKEILAHDPDADIFQLNGIIYKNANNNEWVKNAELTIGEQVGTITKQYRDGITFENEMATKLPVGVEIYEPVKKAGPY